MGSFLLDTVVKPAGRGSKSNLRHNTEHRPFRHMDDRPPRYADRGLLRCSVGYHVFPVYQTHTEEGEKAG